MRVADQAPDRVYPWGLIHTVPAGDPGAVFFETRISEAPRVVIRGCADCRGRPQRVPDDQIPPGWIGLVIVIHDSTCPALRAALKRRGGDQP